MKLSVYMDDLFLSEGHTVEKRLVKSKPESLKLLRTNRFEVSYAVFNHVKHPNKDSNPICM